MNNLLSKMESERFRSIITYCVSENGWNIQRLEDDFASLVLYDDAGSPHLILLTLHGSTIEICHLDDYEFSEFSEIPGVLAKHLLVVNSETKLSFWTIRQISDKYHYTLMYNVEYSQLTPKLLRNVVISMVKMHNDFNDAISGMLNSLA